MIVFAFDSLVGKSAILAGGPSEDQLSPIPCTRSALTKGQHFVAALARAGKGKKGIKTKVKLPSPHKSYPEHQKCCLSCVKKLSKRH